MAYRTQHTKYKFALNSVRKIVVVPNTASWCLAAKQLIRPEETTSLALFVRNLCTLQGDLSHKNAVQLLATIWRAKFAQKAFRYIADPKANDLWQSPKETLELGKGDCEDWGLVCASVLASLGIHSYLAIGTYVNEGHAWVEGTANGEGFLFEPTSGQLHWGLRPYGYRVLVVASRESCTQVSPA